MKILTEDSTCNNHKEADDEFIYRLKILLDPDRDDRLIEEIEDLKKQNDALISQLNANSVGLQNVYNEFQAVKELLLLKDVSAGFDKLEKLRDEIETATKQFREEISTPLKSKGIYSKIKLKLKEALK